MEIDPRGDPPKSLDIESIETQTPIAHIVILTLAEEEPVPTTTFLRHR